jgi:hypothetical protein
MTFALNISKLVKKYNGNVDKAVRTTGFELVRRVVNKTPVDTGRLRGNWQATIDAPATGTIELEDKAGQATIQSAMPAIKQMTGRVFWLSNNLPYARRIEYEGHSSIKAPAGMVRVSIAELQDSLALSQIKGR